MEKKDKEIGEQLSEAAERGSVVAEGALSEAAEKCGPVKKTRRRMRLAGVFTLERVKVGLLAVIAICLVVLVVQNFFPARRDVWVDGGYVDADVEGSVSVNGGWVEADVSGCVDIGNVPHVWVNGGFVNTW